MWGPVDAECRPGERDPRRPGDSAVATLPDGTNNLMPRLPQPNDPVLQNYLGPGMRRL